jgi:hypothetical protein
MADRQARNDRNGSTNGCTFRYAENFSLKVCYINYPFLFTLLSYLFEKSCQVSWQFDLTIIY